MIKLYSAATPNGWKASIALEELNLPYELKVLDFTRLEQKEDWYLKINSNGRIPAITDTRPAEGRAITIFESGAILLYLAEKTGRLMPADLAGRYQVMQWLMFQMGGVGPMQGQANVFFRYAEERIPFAIERYQNETLRLYSVLNSQLAKTEFLAGDYSIADIANWTWVHIHEWSGVSLDGLEHVQRWHQQIEARDAVQRGIVNPPSSISADQEDTKDFTDTARKMLGK